MVDEKKFLDQNGVEYLWSQLSLEDYPNNETLIAVLNAIDETKADKDELFSGSWNDLEDKPFGEEILNESYVEFDGVVTNGKIDDEFWLADANHEPVNIRVIFDGVNYDFLNKDELADDFGDPNFVDYPFYIEPVYLGGAIGTQGKFTCIGGEHTVKIVGLNYTVSAIDPDYLPEGIAYIDYVNEQIAAIPTPDVSDQISTHNADPNSHEDIRQAIETAETEVNNLLNGKVNTSELDNYYTKPEVEVFHDEIKDYVDDEVAALVNSAPETLDTLGELATALQENQEVVDVLNEAITNKYSADNPPPYPVTSVQGKTGEITFTTETWTFTLTNGTTITKTVMLA